MMEAVVELMQDEALHKLVWVLENASADAATKADAAEALGILVFDTNVSREAVMRAGTLPPLMELLSGSLERGRTYATVALGDLAGGHVDVAAAVVVAGAIPLLVELLRSGSDEGKKYASAALGRDLAGANVDIAAAVVSAGTIPLLVELVRSGSADVKKCALAALGSLGVGEPSCG
jgi:vacuolar protein 8